MLAGMGKVIVTPVFVDLEHPAIARAIVEHILEHADLVGHDARGRPVMRFEFPVEDWMIDKLAVFGAAGSDLEPDPVDDDELEEDRVRPVEPEYVRPWYDAARRPASRPRTSAASPSPHRTARRSP
jgi:hypothetical protein